MFHTITNFFREILKTILKCECLVGKCIPIYMISQAINQLRESPPDKNITSLPDANSVHVDKGDINH